jgi:hypothetical protein
MSVLLFCAACPCWMFLLLVHVQVPAACPCCPCWRRALSMLHVYDACLCCRSMLRLYDAFTSWLSMLQDHTACMSMLHDLAACSCRMSILHIHVSCPCLCSCCKSMLHFHDSCPCCTLHCRATGTKQLTMCAARDTIYIQMGGQVRLLKFYSCRIIEYMYCIYTHCAATSMVFFVWDPLRAVRQSSKNSGMITVRAKQGDSALLYSREISDFPSLKMMK